MHFPLHPRAAFVSSLVTALALFGSQPAVGAAIRDLIPRGTGINGMGFATIALAVINYLKGQNAYVSLLVAGLA